MSPLFLNKKIQLTVFSFLFTSFIFAQNLYFPPATGPWETIHTDSLNWCQTELDDLHDFLEEKNTKAFIILKDGRIAIEWYYDTFTQDSIWYWASAGKSLTATLIGIAQEEGLLSIDDPTQNYLGTGWTNTTPEQEAQITIRHQLTMTSGLDDADFNCTDPVCLSYLTEPGSRWSYHNAPYTLLESVIESASVQNINAYYFSKIGNKIGASGAYVNLGYDRVFFSKARAMARFGLLIQANGTWNGTSVLGDMDYLDAMRTPSQAINPSYGYLWWLNGQESYILPGLQLSFNGSLIETAPDDMYAALGKNDQKIYITPSQGLVVIRMGNAANEEPLALSAFDPELWDKITDLACTTGGLDENLNLKPAISLFPNPANDELHINTNEIVEKIDMHNSKGQLVLRSSKKHLFISDIPSGVYFLNIHLKEKTPILKRIIIQ